ncbi:TetR/AcrR family transcriptional regulator [uncultured Tateyamaria sp.]|uniref:TetR/AcrR family transcriptional regulator n=1 Tax=uncultured Tateyamaria sp. TaxID=455651 RepID=UPI00261804FC|nr:TetR/AcrR family transcriptional regulator [uncultured Tateyamaria sp.]
MRPSKREELVNKALDVFYRGGFHATGMDMIVEETGISKTAIYNHFRTKDDLILAVLRRRDEVFRNWLFKRMSELGASEADQLVAMFDALGEWFREPSFKGCMFIKAVAEFQDPDHPAFKHSVEHKGLIEKYLLGLAQKSKLQHPETLVKRLLILKEGAINAAQFRSIPAPAEEAKETARLLIAA